MRKKGSHKTYRNNTPELSPNDAIGGYMHTLTPHGAYSMCYTCATQHYPKLFRTFIHALKFISYYYSCGIVFVPTDVGVQYSLYVHAAVWRLMMQQSPFSAESGGCYNERWWLTFLTQTWLTSCRNLLFNTDDFTCYFRKRRKWSAALSCMTKTSVTSSVKARIAFTTDFTKT